MPETAPGDSKTPWLAWLARAGRGLLDLVYPPRCPGCGRMGVLFCERCQARVIRISEPVCQQCGRPLERPARRCPSCRRATSALSGIRSAALYVDPLRLAIRHFKYHNCSDLAQPLAALMMEAWQRWPRRVDQIVPVPLHRTRERLRGYNQSALLAHAVAASTGIPYNDCLLARQRPTRPQVELAPHERQTNVVGAFHCPASVDDLRILLVDDVCTTGSTLEACAVALKAAGAAAVWGFTLARAPGQQDANLIDF